MINLWRRILVTKVYDECAKLDIKRGFGPFVIKLIYAKYGSKA